MKRYSTLHPLVMAFYSPKIYRDVAFAWRGACLLYLLILIALAQIPAAVRFHYGTKEFVRTEAPPIVAQVPRMKFAGGTLSTEEQRPYSITDPRSGKLLAIIDTTGATRVLGDTAAAVLFTATQVSVRKNTYETQTIAYSKNHAFTVTRERLTRLLDLFAAYAAIALYPFAVILALAYRIVQALVLALAGILCAKSMRVGLPFPAIYRLTVTAMTPAIVLAAAGTAAGAAIPFGGLISLALMLGYLVAALRFCKGET